MTWRQALAFGGVIFALAVGFMTGGVLASYDPHLFRAAVGLIQTVCLLLVVVGLALLVVATLATLRAERAKPAPAKREAPEEPEEPTP